MFQRLLFAILHWLQIPQLFIYLNRSPRILLYHGVTESLTRDGIKNHRKKHIRTDAFETHLRLMLRYFTIVSLSELIEKTHTGNARGYAAITFDDGYENFYTQVFPLLKKYKISCTFYIAGDFVDHKTPLWVDRLEYSIGHTKETHLLVKCGTQTLEYPLSTDTERMHADDSIRAIAKRIPNDQRLQLVEQVEQRASIALPTTLPQDSFYAPVTWEQCLEMQESGLVEFGAHTLTHPILSSLSSSDLSHELSGSVELLTNRLGRAPITFAYPNGGKEDFNSEVIVLLKSLGISNAPTTIERFLKPTDNPYMLPRLTIDNANNPNHFLFRISGLRGLYMRVMNIGTR